MSTPQQIGRYQVRGRIGSGGFATVWRAYDGDLDNDVAVKILAENWIERTDIHTRFVEEARILRRADSDRIVRVHDIGALDDGRPYFVMSYADAGTLSERIAGGQLSLEQVLEYATSAARGVAILHDLGVLHRDIKPSNILFRSTATGEQLMIADLGLAKAIAHASGFTVAAGTPGYMAPEQAQAGGDIDRRVDVYALGALTYQMLTGSKPAPASTGQPQRPPSELRAGLPAEVDAFVLRALERDRGERWADAAEFADAASRTARALSGAAAPPASQPQQAQGQGQQQAQPQQQQAQPQAQYTQPQQAQGQGQQQAQQPVYGGFTPTTTPTVGPTTQQATPDAPARMPYPTPQPLPEHPSFPGQRHGGAPAPRRRGRRRWPVVTASLLAVLLAGVGVLVWSQLRPVTVRTSNSSVVAKVPSEWVEGQPISNAPEDMGPFGRPGKDGVRLTTQSNFDTLDSSPGITVVASRSFDDVSKAAFGEQAPPTQMWDTSSCDKPSSKQVQPANLGTGTLRTWTGCGDATLGQAVVAGDGYGVQVFLVQRSDQDRFEDVLDTVEVDKGKLP